MQSESSLVSGYEAALEKIQAKEDTLYTRVDNLNIQLKKSAAKVQSFMKNTSGNLH